MSEYIRRFGRFLGKNEAARGLLLVGIIIIGILSVWEGIRLGLNTQYPVLVVVSPSMVPTLQVGDLIVIRGQNPSTIKVGPAPVGSIIVFRPPCCSPNLNDPNYLVVHRVVERNPTNPSNFDTHGDNNGGNDLWDSIGVPPSNIVGVYQYTIPIPYLGSTVLAIRGFMYDDQTGQPRPQGLAVIVALIIALFAFEVIQPPKKKKVDLSQPSDAGKKTVQPGAETAPS